ncbi:MAG: hypothetical protein DRN37_00585 [Thermoplasmata archaeon]|nr:MAG: hypothetical protein DRN07_00335 [Thermoplasmata archaeon]RLF61625.1 MAG: hypothetical protein DRN37_00585 [Thermoplasmata archaeon]
MEKRSIVLYAVTASALWGTSFPITKIALEGASPVLLAFLRYLLTSILFLSLSLFYKNFYHIKIKNFVLLGIISVTAPTILQNIGLQYTSAYITGFLQSTGPIYTVILAYFFLQETITRYKVLGILLALGGTYFITSPQSGGDLFGNLLVLSSAICYSLGGIVAKRTLNLGYTPVQIVAFSSIFGTLFLFPAALFEHGTMAAESAPYILFLAIFTTFISYTLWYSAMERMELSKLSFFVFLIPIFSIFFSAVLLQEEMKALTLAAGFVAVCGVAIAQRK